MAKKKEIESKTVVLADKRVSNDTQKKLDKFLKQVNAAPTKDAKGNIGGGYGEGFVSTEKVRTDFKVISTGILQLDLASGIGGIPIANKPILISGQESQGKTELYLRIIASAQKYCMWCVQYLDRCTCGKKEPMVVNLVDAENDWDEKWAVSKGINPDLIIRAIPDSLESMHSYVEDSLRQNLFSLTIIDSVAPLAPEKEIEGGQGDWQQGLGARLHNKAWRAWTQALNASERVGFNQCVISLNQLREKTNVKFANPFVLPYGKAQYFMCHMHIRMNAPEYKTETNPFTGAKESYMVGLKGYFIKNKLAPAKGEFSFDMYTRDYKEHKKGAVDEIGFVIKCCEKLSWFNKESATKWTWIGPIEFKFKIDVVDEKTGEITAEGDYGYVDKDGGYFKTKGSLTMAVTNKERLFDLRTRVIHAIENRWVVAEDGQGDWEEEAKRAE